MLNKKAQLTQGLRATAVCVYRHLGFLKFKSCTISSAVPKNPTLEPNSTSIGKPVAKLTHGHFCISKMAVSRHLGFYRIGNSAIRSAFPENHSLKPNMEWIRCTICEIFAFKLYCDLQTGVWGHSRSLKVTPFDSLHMVSYYRPIVTLCLKCTLHCFRDMTTYWSKIAEKTYPTLIWHVPLGWPLANFFDDSYLARN